MTPDAEFDALTARVDALRAKLAQVYPTLNEQYKAAVIRFASAGMKSRKWDFDKAWESIADEQREAIRARYAAVMVGESDDYKQAIDAHEKRLHELAPTCTRSDPAERVWRQWKHVYNAWSSAGPQYVRINAEEYAHRAMRYGYEARAEAGPLGTHQLAAWYGPGHYTVQVLGTVRDLRLLDHLPTWDNMRAAVAWYMRKGGNPRVFLPFLPYDYEQSAGLDYYGHETTSNAE